MSVGSISSAQMEPALYSNKKKPKNKGILRAGLLSSVIALPATALNIGLIKGLRDITKLSQEQHAQLTQATNKALDISGLAKKGVEVFKMNEEKFSFQKYLFPFILDYNSHDTAALKALEEEIKAVKSPFTKWQISKAGGPEMAARDLGKWFKLGVNACYLPNTNKIITPSSSLRPGVFHEMGHALNNNGGILLKSLRKCRPLMIFAPVILLVSLLNKRKVSDKTKKEDGIIQKTADFIKKNAGKLTALIFLPKVLEEGIASLRGQKLAKTLVKSGDLSKEIFKKVKLGNLVGFASYSLALGLAVLSTKLAINIKDKIQAKYEEKIATK